MKQRRTKKPKSKSEETACLRPAGHSTRMETRTDCTAEEKEGGRKLIDVEDCVNMKTSNLKGRATERKRKVLESWMIGENTWEEKMKEGREQTYDYS